MIIINQQQYNSLKTHHTAIIYSLIYLYLNVQLNVRTRIESGKIILSITKSILLHLSLEKELVLSLLKFPSCFASKFSI